jgi:hypothetical protein
VEKGRYRQNRIGAVQLQTLVNGFQPGDDI